MLHLVFNLSDVSLLRRLQSPDSVVVFFDNAVASLFEKSLFETTLIDLMRLTPCYVLNEDLACRGIKKENLIKGIICINYTELVHMTINQTPICTWN